MTIDEPVKSSAVPAQGANRPMTSLHLSINGDPKTRLAEVVTHIVHGHSNT